MSLPCMAVRETAEHLIEGFDGRARAFIQVQQGCDHRPDGGNRNAADQRNRPGNVTINLEAADRPQQVHDAHDQVVPPQPGEN